MSPGFVKQLSSKHVRQDLRVRVHALDLREEVVESLVLVGATDTHAQLRLKPSAFDSRSLVKRSGEIIAIPNRDVHEVFVKDHAKGFLVGAGVGLGAVAFATVLGAAAYSEDDDFFKIGRGGNAALSGFVLGGPVFLVSMLVGAIVGHTTHYRF